LKKKTAYFCSSAYHVFTAINLKSHDMESESDLYILNNFGSSKTLRDNAEKLGMFKKVVLLDTLAVNKRHSLDNTLLRYYQKIHNLVFYKSLLKDYMDLDVYYDHVYIGFPDLVTQYAIIHFKTLNKNLKVSIYEDGLISYYRPIYPIKGVKKLFKKLFKKYSVLDEYDEYLFYDRTLCNASQEEYNIVNIPKIKPDDEFLKKAYNTVYNYTENDDFDEKYVYIEQLLKHFSQDVTDIDFDKRNMDIYNQLIDNMDNDKLLLKIHPRSSADNYPKGKIYKNSDAIWEVCCMNNDMRDRAVISVSSSAVFTPKLVFDFEPTVILLYKLVLKGVTWEYFDDLNNYVEKFKKLYSDESKILIPETEEEFAEILKNLK